MSNDITVHELSDHECAQTDGGGEYPRGPLFLTGAVRDALVSADLTYGSPGPFLGGVDGCRYEDFTR